LPQHARASRRPSAATTNFSSIVRPFDSPGDVGVELSEPLRGVPLAAGESPPVQDATAPATTTVSSSARPRDDQRRSDPSCRTLSRWPALDIEAPHVRAGLMSGVRGIQKPTRSRALAGRTPRALASAGRILGSWHRTTDRAMARLGHASTLPAEPPSRPPRGAADRPTCPCRNVLPHTLRRGVTQMRRERQRDVRLCAACPTSRQRGREAVVDLGVE
jgi:hypothetical protein